MTSAEGQARTTSSREPILQTPKSGVSRKLKMHYALQTEGGENKPTSREVSQPKPIAKQIRIFGTPTRGRRPASHPQPSNNHSNGHPDLDQSEGKHKENHHDTSFVEGEVRSLYHHMQAEALNLELQSKHAPKFISSLNKVPQSPAPIPKINFFSANLDRQRSKVTPGWEGGAHPASMRKFLVKLPKKASNVGNSWVEPPSPDIRSFINGPAQVPVNPALVNSLQKGTKESLGRDDDILETFSRNAQYKTSKRRMTKMTKIPLIVKESSEMDTGSEEESSEKSQVSGHSFADKRLPVTDHNNKGESDAKPRTADLAVHFKDLLNHNLGERIILDIKQARQSRPSIDLGVLAQDQMWMKLGSSQEMRVHSTKPFQLKSKIHIRSSGAIRELSSGNLALAGDRPHSAKKKVVFAKNKMVLLFEKDF